MYPGGAADVGTYPDDAANAGIYPGSAADAGTYPGGAADACTYPGAAYTYAVFLFFWGGFLYGAMHRLIDTLKIKFSYYIVFVIILLTIHIRMYIFI